MSNEIKTAKIDVIILEDYIIPYNVSSSQTVKGFKQILAKDLKIPSNQFSLKLNGRILSGKNEINHYMHVCSILFIYLF